MRRKGYGRIINICSQLAHKGGADMAHYSAAKAGIIGFTRSLAYEVAKTASRSTPSVPGRSIPTSIGSCRRTGAPQDDRADRRPARQGRGDRADGAAARLRGGGFYVGATLNPNGGDIMV